MTRKELETARDNLEELLVQKTAAGRTDETASILATLQYINKRLTVVGITPKPIAYVNK